jgi:nitrous oxide reductase accessory protein NosL
MDRRTALRTLATVACGGSLAGCSGGSGGGEPTPTPVALSGQKRDDRGGMVIGNHGGPNGQIFYADNSPAGHDNPAWFHTLAFGLFPYYFERRRDGWTATAIYVTDYSTVDYTVTDGERRSYMPAPTAAETFGDATGMTYVVESGVSGGMGAELFPFSAAGDARSFVEEYGGRTVAFDGVTPELVAEYTRR